MPRAGAVARRIADTACLDVEYCGQPETVNAWLDTYLKYREVRETSRAADAAEAIADDPPTGA